MWEEGAYIYGTPEVHNNFPWIVDYNIATNLNLLLKHSIQPFSLSTLETQFSLSYEKLV